MATKSDDEFFIIADDEEAQFDEEEEECSDDVDNSDDASSGTYFVEKILKKRTYKGKVQYQVKWQNYPDSQNTWEPIEHLDNVMDLVEKFEQENRKGKGNEQEITYNKQSAVSKPSETTGTRSRRRLCMIEDEDDDEQHLLNVRESMQNARTKKPTILAPLENDANSAGLLSERSQAESKADKGLDKTKQLKGRPRGRGLKIPEEGHLKYKDEPKRIVSVVPSKDGETVLFKVEWYTRAGGEIPTPSWVSNQDFRKYSPRFLLDFYETKLTFVIKKQDQNGKTIDNGQLKSIEANDKDKIMTNDLMKNIETEKKPADFRSVSAKMAESTIDTQAVDGPAYKVPDSQPSNQQPALQASEQPVSHISEVQQQEMPTLVVDKPQMENKLLTDQPQVDKQTLFDQQESGQQQDMQPLVAAEQIVKQTDSVHLKAAQPIQSTQSLDGNSQLL